MKSLCSTYDFLILKVVGFFESFGCCGVEIKEEKFRAEARVALGTLKSFPAMLASVPGQHPCFAQNMKPRDGWSASARTRRKGAGPNGEPNSFCSMHTSAWLLRLRFRAIRTR
jgi:hypothetical protein